MNNLLAAAAAGRVCSISDGALAVEFLRHIQPQWIDEIPTLASSLDPGSNVVTRSAWDEQNGVIVLVTFFGRGFSNGENGWAILIKSCRSREEADTTTALIRAMGQQAV
ncbi:MAG: hypothetical protein NTX04_09685 [Verrucomicrobia bacterium]|nr:hypothetical protein [Verrucomicrobiota bacterium]